MGKIKDWIISQHTDDTDYGAPETQKLCGTPGGSFATGSGGTSVAYRFIRNMEEQIGAPGSLGSEELMDDDGADIDPDSGDNYPEGWDESDLGY